MFGKTTKEAHPLPFDDNLCVEFTALHRNYKCGDCRHYVGVHENGHPHACTYRDCKCRRYHDCPRDTGASACAPEPPTSPEYREVSAFGGTWLEQGMKHTDAVTFTRAQLAIARECDTVKGMLLEKNRKYGNAALEPLAIFTKATPAERLQCRLDEKLARIKTMGPDAAVDEDTTFDLIGCLVLLRLAKAAEHADCEVKGCGKFIERDGLAGMCNLQIGHIGDCDQRPKDRNAHFPECPACQAGEVCKQHDPGR